MFKKITVKLVQKQEVLILISIMLVTFRCKYCFTNSPKGDHVKEYLDFKAIASLADQADDFRIF